MVLFMKKLWWLALAGAAVGGVALLALRGRTPPAAGQGGPPPDPEAVAVTVAPVTPRPVRRSVEVVGTLQGYEELTITPKVEGRVLKVYADVGDVVRPGDRLLDIEDVDYKHAVAEAERAVEMELAKIGLEEMPDKDVRVDKLPTVVRAKELEDNALREQERTTRAGRAAPWMELDKAITTYKVARATREQAAIDARATLAAARHKQAVLATARQRLADTRVVAPPLSAPAAAVAPASSDAPLKYVVARRLVSEGEMVRAFPSMAAFRLVVDRTLKLMATVPERHVGEVEVGQPVAVRVEAYAGEPFHARVARVHPTVDPVSRTFQVEVAVPNPDRRLRAGGFAKARVFTRTDARAATVPEEALVTFAGVTKVFVVRGGQAYAVPVRVGARPEPSAGRGERWVEVRGDLPAGSAVVTSGQSQLAEGTPVRVRRMTR